jgi:hypothetical protein
VAVAAALTVGSSAPGQTGSAYADAVLADAPVGYWRLGETAGTSAVDSSGHAHAGTYLGGVVLGVPGALPNDTNAAARFDGGNDRVTVAGVADPGTADFTLEAWIKTAGATSDQVVAGKKGSGNAGSWWFVVVTVDSGHVGQLRARVRNGSVTRTAYSTARVDDGAWHHVVVRFDRDVGIGFYVDGAPVGSSAGVSTGSVANTGAFGIGLVPGSGNFKGDLDEVAVYASLLSTAQVQAHFAAGRGS